MPTDGLQVPADHPTGQPGSVWRGNGAKDDRLQRRPLPRPRDRAGHRLPGVDISASLVAQGRLRAQRRGASPDRYRFAEGDVSGLSRVLAEAGLEAHSRDTIVVFGFSVLSALDDLDSVAESLRRLDVPFAATLYETTNAATAMRLEYYRHCGLEPVSVERDDRGAWLRTAGYRTLAPRHSYVTELFARHGLSARIELMSELGFVCISEET